MARKNYATDSPSSTPLPWEGAALVGLLAVLVLWQGGYYAASACIVGMLAAGCAAVSAVISARARCGREGNVVIPLLFAGVGACSLASSVVHGLTLTGLAESAPWFAVAALAFLHASLPDTARATTMRAVVWLGIACAVLGLALMSMPGAVEGAVNAGRMQFPFQYANTSGIFYAACAVLALGSNNGRLQRAAVFPLAALLFTQSAGACGLFACAFAVLCVRWWRAAAFARVAEATLLVACVACAFAFCFVVGTGWALVAAATSFAAGSLALGRLGRVRSAKRAAVVACVLLAVCVFACAGLLVQMGRVAQAGQTFVERLIQMGDAAAVAVANPVFGIGPDAWRFLYPYVQSAQYTATSVHCGYLQIALDVGWIGVALFVFAVVAGTRGAISCRNVPIACAILMIAVHGAIDIDFQFSALLAFLAMLLTGCAKPAVARYRGLAFNGLRGARESQGRGRTWRATFVATFLTTVLMASVCGLWVTSVKDECVSAAKLGDANAIRQVIEQNPLAEHDDSVRSHYGEALWRTDSWSELAHVFGEDSISSADQALFAAEAFYALGDDAHAEDVLLTELERELGNVDLFARARFQLATHDASEEAQERYRLAAVQANVLSSTGLAPLMGNQEHLPETLS